MALWVLSKTSMIFFILALFAIILMGTSAWKKSFCTSQADILASQITGNINQVMNSPLEDEVRIFALEPVLSVGGEKLQKYQVEFSFIPDKKTFEEQAYPNFIRYDGRIIVKVSTEEGCSSSKSIAYSDFVTIPKTFSLQEPPETEDLCGKEDPARPGIYPVCKELYDDNSEDEQALSSYRIRIKAIPSYRGFDSSGTSLPTSNYFILMKCTNKNSTAVPFFSKFFFLDNCYKALPNDCTKFNDDSNAYTNIQGVKNDLKISEICEQNPRG